MKKDTRPGEELWCEWSGSGYEKTNPESTVYYTLDHVDMDGPLLLSEDIATGITFDNGTVHITDKPGLGITLL